MNQHLAPIMNRRPLTAGRHNSRQRLPKPQTVSETPQNKQTPMRRDLIAAPRHPHITSTATIHLGDAPSSGSDTCRDTRIIPHRRGFSANAHPLNAKTRERSGLAVVEGRPYDDLAEGPREITVLRRGAEPSRQVFEDADTHDLALCETLLEASRQKGTDIGDLAVLVPTLRLVQHYLTQIADLELPTLSLEDYEGLPTSAVKVGTYKRSKGLEFKQVFLPRLDLVDLSHQDSTDQANSERQDILRRSIFVAVTRARDRIWLGGVSAQRQADWWTITHPPTPPRTSWPKPPAWDATR